MENRWRSNESLIEQNLDKNKEKFRQQIKLAFKTGDKNENRHNWVLETSREATDILIKKERFYIGCNCCRIQDYIVATRLTCVINVTTPPNIAGMRKKSAVIEQRKGMPSRINALINQRIPYCHKCKRGGKPSSYIVTDKTCPSYAVALNQVLLRTYYGP